MTKRLCVFHAADNDGKCSAAIVKRKYPDVELYGWDYGRVIPWDKIKEADEVIMVDIALQPYDLMDELAKQTKLVWIDHHNSSIKFYKENKIPGTIILKDGVAACILTWEHYFPGEDLPDGVKYLGDYDIWNHKDPDCKRFEFGLRSYNTDPNAYIWLPILDYTWASDPTDYEELAIIISKGRAVLDYIEGTYEYLSKEYSYEKEIDGFKFLVANNPHRTSMYFDSIWDAEKYDGVLSYFWTGQIWKVSIYTERDDVDVSKIAEKYGGGGHRKAGGFQTNDINWLTKGDGNWAQHSQSK